MINVLNTGNSVQKIGLDIGRGYTKGYTIYEAMLKSCIFKSSVTLGSRVNFSDYDNPICIEVNDGPTYFVGALAEFEGKGKGQVLVDDKTNFTIEVLLCAALQELAVQERVDIVLGMPKKLTTQETREKIIKKYKGKSYVITDKVKNEKKVVTINDIDICREADAALMGQVAKSPELKNGPVGMAVLGFRTLELAFYDKGFKFNNAKSKTFELGNITTLEYVQLWLSEKEIMKTVGEIDSSDEYNKLKHQADRMVLQEMNNYIETSWINLSEIMIICAGGTMINLHKLEEFDYELIDNPQMAVAKGLFEVAKIRFRER